MPVQPSVLYTRTPGSFIFFVIWSPIFAGTSLYCAFTPALPFPPFFPPDKYLSLKSKNSVLLSGRSHSAVLGSSLPMMGSDEPRTAEYERPLNKTEFFDFSDKYLS